MFGQSRRNVVHSMAARMQVPRGCEPSWRSWRSLVADHRIVMISS
jgi:hypothetical protein